MAARKRNIHRGSFKNKAAFEAHLNKWLEKVRELYGDIPRFDLVYFPKGRSAGWWKYSSYRHTLEFNVEAIENHFDQMVNETLPHEISHMLD